MLRRLNNWLYGIEQRIEKWARLQSAYWHGYKSCSKYQVGIDHNPWQPGTDEHYQWQLGWNRAKGD